MKFYLKKENELLEKEIINKCDNHDCEFNFFLISKAKRVLGLSESREHMLHVSIQYYWLKIFRMVKRNSVLQSLINLQVFRDIFLNLPQESPKTNFIVTLRKIINVKLQNQTISKTLLSNIVASLGFKFMLFYLKFSK